MTDWFCSNLLYCLLNLDFFPFFYFRWTSSISTASRATYCRLSIQKAFSITFFEFKRTKIRVIVKFTDKNTNPNIFLYCKCLTCTYSMVCRWFAEFTFQKCNFQVWCWLKHFKSCLWILQSPSNYATKAFLLFSTINSTKQWHDHQRRTKFCYCRKSFLNKLFKIVYFCTLYSYK